jgi:hypothetical protein
MVRHRSTFPGASAKTDRPDRQLPDRCLSRASPDAGTDSSRRCRRKSSRAGPRTPRSEWCAAPHGTAPRLCGHKRQTSICQTAVPQPASPLLHRSRSVGRVLQAGYPSADTRGCTQDLVVLVPAELGKEVIVDQLPEPLVAASAAGTTCGRWPRSPSSPVRLGRDPRGGDSSAARSRSGSGSAWVELMVVRPSRSSAG